MLQLFSTKTDLVSRKFDDEANENETKKKKKSENAVKKYPSYFFRDIPRFSTIARVSFGDKSS